MIIWFISLKLRVRTQLLSLFVEYGREFQECKSQTWFSQKSGVLREFLGRFSLGMVYDPLKPIDS